MACKYGTCTGNCYKTCVGCSNTCDGCTGCSNQCGKDSCTGCKYACYSCEGCYGCSAACKNDCTSCSGCSGCSAACKNDCTSCSGCSGCSAACKTNCSGCTGTCTGGCTNCSGCSGGCTACTGTCSGDCNNGCSGQNTTTIYNRIAIHEIIYRSDIEDVRVMMNNELSRRGKSATGNAAVSIGDLIQYATTAQQAKTNLEKMGKTVAIAAGLIPKQFYNDCAARLKELYAQNLKS